MPTIKHDLPGFSLDATLAAARDLFGVDATGAPLPSERDQNVLLTTATG